MSIKDTAQRLTDAKVAFFTGYMVEEAHSNAGEKPKKALYKSNRKEAMPSHKNIKAGDWKMSHITPDHNTVVLITGERSNNIILVDWDLQEWNHETQTMEFNNSVVEQYNKMKDLLWAGEEPTTYTELTGNGGVHWLFKYDPAKVNGIIKERNGFKLNNIKCGDIKADGGLCYLAPTTYKSLNGEDKNYEVECYYDFDKIAMIPDILFKHIQFNIKSNPTKVTLKRAEEQPESESDSGIGSSNSVEEIEDSDTDDAYILPSIAKLETEEDFVQGYLNCIDPNDYQNYMNVCFTFGTMKKYHMITHQWAKQSKKYNKKITEEFLAKANGQKTIASISYMAKQNIEKYSSIFGAVYDKEKELLNMIETFNDKNIAEFYYKYTKYEHFYDEKSKQWFSLDARKVWFMSDALPEKNKKNMINFIENRLKKYKEYILLKRKNCSDDEDKKKIGCVGFDNINKYILKIGGNTFIKNVIDMLKGFYVNKAITDILVSQDTNRYKFAFDNCLFDLKTKEIRPIIPEDYIIITTGYDYDIDAEPKKIDDVNRILTEIMEPKEVKGTQKESSTGYISDLQNLKNTLSAMLCGYNLKRKFNILAGVGCNGKSMVVDNLLKPAFGAYYASISPTYFTKADHNSNCATPELADKQYVRALCLSEPEVNEKFQSSKLKKQTGMDEVQARGLYKDGKTWKPQYTPLCLCNDIPELASVDRATLGRMNIMNLNNQFVNEPDPNNKFQRQMNIDLPVILNNDAEYKKSFMWVLIENYKTMNNNLISKNCKEANEKYVTDNNPILTYIEERIEKVNGEKIQCKDVYADYMNYCLNNNIKALSNIAFSKLMKFNNFSQETDGKRYFWNNIKLKENGEM